MKKTLRNLLISTSASTSALIACASLTAQAQLLNVKIGQSPNDSGASGAYQESAAAVLGSANDWWNEYDTSAFPSGASVVDSTDAALSGITLTVAHSGGAGNLSTSGGNPSFLMGYAAYQNAGGVFTISLAGLLADTDYEFVGYGSSRATWGALWTVTTGTLVSGTTSNDGSSPDISSGDGVAYSNFIAKTDASGNLAVTDTSPTSSFVMLNGFQLQAVAVPEPSTMALAITGGLGLLAGIRFRRRLLRS